MVTGLLGTNTDKAEVRKGVASPTVPLTFVCLAKLWIKKSR